MTNNVELQLTGMAASNAPQAFFAKVGGGNLESLVECLKTTQNVKTLASPRILVCDGQEANIQVGEQLGYKVTTTTETSTMQDVRFLNVGVILTVTPHIGRDDRVWMKVLPKVSTGQINPKTELPEEKTSQVTSQVLLDNGQGIVIGGLIQEKDSTNVQKLPFLGDIWLAGILFQRRKVEKFRTETIVALVPHIQPYDGGVAEREREELARCQTPLLNQTNCLEPVSRPWEPVPPDPCRPPAFLHKFGRADAASCTQPAATTGTPTPAAPIPAAVPEGHNGGSFDAQPPLPGIYGTPPGQPSGAVPPPPPVPAPPIGPPPEPPTARRSSEATTVSRLPPVSTQWR
jgi:hypothetical protein